jgi:hypothetical protein
MYRLSDFRLFEFHNDFGYCQIVNAENESVCEIHGADLDQCEAKAAWLLNFLNNAS